MHLMDATAYTLHMYRHNIASNIIACRLRYCILQAASLGLLRWCLKCAYDNFAAVLHTVCRYVRTHANVSETKPWRVHWNRDLDSCMACPGS